MTRKEALARWIDPEFVTKRQPELDALFSGKEIRGPADLAGLTIGLDGQLTSLSMSDFQDVVAENLDLRFGRFSCAFSRCIISYSSFASCQFDTCRFPNSEFLACDFTAAKLVSPWLDDVIFEKCVFKKTSFSGKGAREYGGRRCTFVSCRFEEMLFRNIQFRAARFVDCEFIDVRFCRCAMIGVKFIGTAPSDNSFEDCELKISKEIEEEL